MHKAKPYATGGAMTFDHPWALLALLLPLGWAAWEWRETARRLALGLKAAAFVCIVLALSGPRVVVYQTKVAVAVLADTSASVSPQDLARESAIANQVERGAGRHWTRVIPFARNTRLVSLEEKSKDGWQLRHTAGAAGRGTDLENAIRDGAAALAAGVVARPLLVSHRNREFGRVARGHRQGRAAPHGRGRGGGAGGRGAAPAADLRMQREFGQRRARHLAGAAVGPAH